MLGRVAAVVIAFLAALPSFAQCNYTPVRSAQFRSSALDLAIDGNDLWVATSYGISLYDRSADPPKLMATLPVPGTTRVVRAQNGIAYAGSGSSLVVVRKSGAHALAIAGTIDAGGTVNDMVLTTLDLYVATTAGIAQYDLLNPVSPARTNAAFPTSRTAVTSLASIGLVMYAADGDSSIEAFDLSVRGIPRLIGSVTAPAPINFVRANNAKLYASSGLLATYVFSGTGASMANVGSAAFGTASLAPVTGDVAFMAGNDRRLHAVDFGNSAAPVEVFRDDLPPTGGTINRISSMAATAKRLYVAAGDIGLLTYDITSFAAPFAIRAYSTGGGSSVFFLATNVADRVYVGRDSGGITEFTQSANGGLTQARSWDGSKADTVWDGSNGLLLTSSGTSLTLWTVQSSTPQVVTTATFAAPIASAVLVGTTAYVVLNNGSVFSADMSQATPQPKAAVAGTLGNRYLTRSGSSVLLTALNDQGTTDLSYFATGDLSLPPKTASVPGIAATRPALSGASAAALTFGGITIIDFAADSRRALPGSTGLARGLLLNGTALYVLTDTSLVVWDTQKQAVVNQFTLPADPIAMHAAPASAIVDVVTSTGVVTIVTNAASRLPAILTAANSNAYYRRVVTGADFIDLYDGHDVDIYNSLLRYINTLRNAMAAADTNGVYTISPALLASSYTADGGYLRNAQPLNIPNARAVGIDAVGGAAWVSVESGCPTCIRTTYVFDPRSGMNLTLSLTGGVVDVAVSGNRAYVLTEFPSEIRVMNISDPFHPSTIVSAPAPQSPVSIAYANGIVYILGDKLTAYSESTLTRLGDILGSYPADPTGVVTPADQRVRIDGNCAIVVGRGFSPQLYTISGATSWTAAPTPPLPSATRSVATQPGVIQLLTDHSLETWSTKPLPKPVRRR